MDLSQEKILVTGGNGFLGQHVCSVLLANGCKEHFGRPGPSFYRPQSAYFDLTDERLVTSVYATYKPTIVIHLAAVVGGIGANRLYPGTFYYKNLIMGALMMEHARLNNIKKFVAIGTICAYPNHAPIPFKEDTLWDGYPEPTNAPYGIAKKVMLVQSQAYRQEFGFNSIYLLPVNLYGPGDNFNEKTSHVIPALIKKCIEARDKNLDYIECWGTGAATREFLYVQDAAEAIILATEYYDKPEPVNIGANAEISIKELVNIIATLTKFNGEIRWNAVYPDGQPRRCLNTERAQKEFGFIAKTKFLEGLQKTIDWYESNKK